VTVRLKPDADLEATKARLEQSLGLPYTVSTWKDLFKDFLWVLDLEKNMMFFLMLFVVLVAAFAMGAAQLMTVLRKTREIGLIMAMGSTTTSIASVYALQGALVGVAGVIVGNVFALVILFFRNDILGAIAGWTGTAETFEKFYQFSHLPMSYSIADFLIIAAAAIILATVSGLIPALMVSRLKPAEALRNE
jgi:lipoprotein-releasing system permease protein